MKGATWGLSILTRVYCEYEIHTGFYRFKTKEKVKCINNILLIICSNVI